MAPGKSASSQHTEHSPLLQTVPTARTPPRRYPYQRLRVVSTVVLSVICALGVALFFTPLGQSLKFASYSSKPSFTFNDLKDILLNTPDEKQVREWSKYYTAGPHLAGKNLSQAEWTRDRWQEFGIEDTSIVSYDVYVNYPNEKNPHRLALLEEDNEGKTTVKYEAALVEDVLEEDPTTGLPNSVPTFHGYSASGNVTGQYVFVNYGTFHDFDDLVKANVSLEGKIALAKYGRIFRGLKVKRAQELGMIGCIVYEDPGDDAVTEQTNATYPDGPARNPSSVQRGSVQFLSFAPGDPTTPGYPSKPDAPRTDTDHAIPKIPSIPISYSDALPLLKALNGYGLKASDFNEYWQNGGLGYKGVEYNIGPSPPSLTLNLVNNQDYTTTPFWNVIGIINGTLPDEAIVLGNHRDAWIAGGAADPNSGSAAFNEVIRGLGAALKQGWKPHRTIVLASWDGEEYGLVGSTEWVEEYLPWVSQSTVAYLNVDVGAAGSSFSAAAAPLLHKVLTDTLTSIPSPNQTVPDQTVYDVWTKHIAPLGSGSDYTAFQDFAGVPSIDMGFKTAKVGPIYQYHSNYDSFHWMDTFGDPTWEYHTTIAKVWGLLTAKLVEAEIIPFNATDYAVALESYVAKIDKQIEEAGLRHDLVTQGEKPDTTPWSLHNLTTSIWKLSNAARALDQESALLSHYLSDPLPTHSHIPGIPASKAELATRIKAVNHQYQFFERQMLYADGLDQRSWFKHVVYAPGRWTGYAGTQYPGLVESVEDGDKDNFAKWEGIVVERVEAVIKLLEG